VTGRSPSPSALGARRVKGRAPNGVQASSTSGPASPEAGGRRPETIAAQAGGTADATTGGIVPPIHLATTFVRDADNQYRRGYCYGRSDNATVRQVEHVLRELDHGAASLLFASGMAAATNVFLALERPAHVIAPTVMYWGLRQWLTRDAPSHGLDVTFVDAGSLGALRAAIKPGRTKLVWIETPSNPTWVVTDIAEAARCAHDAGALLAVDSTVPTPVLTRPIALGADVVVHSATKYLNGHSDVVAGALVLAHDDQLYERAARQRGMLGAIIGPFEAALLLRGLRTLHVRVRHQSAAAMAIAECFADAPAIADVLYPGLRSHPGHAIAARQMHGGFGGMLSLRVRGGEAAAVAAAARMRVWQRATSLGGVESLVEHRASIEGPGSPCPPDLLRLSVGLESVDDLIADIAQALSPVAPARRRRNGARSTSTYGYPRAGLPSASASESE
jgi:cystathionine gamma-synthase